MSGNQVAVIPGQTQQQVAVKQPSHVQLAERIFHRSSHKSGEVTSQQIAEYHKIVHDAEQRDLAELTSGLAPPHIEMANKTFARFTTPALTQFVTEAGLRYSLHPSDLLARVGYHIEKLEQEIAALKAGRR